MMLSSTPAELKYDSSTTMELLFPRESGVAVCGRPIFDGLPNVEGVSFMEVSKAVGRSFAPGGFLFLLGLP
jgi:hypothetical protein